MSAWHDEDVEELKSRRYDAVRTAAVGPGKVETVRGVSISNAPS